MDLAADSYIFGFVGSFGSGCTTFAKVAATMAAGDLKLQSIRLPLVSLSDPIRDEWKKLEGRKPRIKQRKHPPRWELQNIGNKLRTKNGAAWLAMEAVRRLERLSSSKSKLEYFIVDSIRNPAEVDFFRSRFPNFFLIHVQCTRDQRWRRVQKDYEARGETAEDFLREDNRDSNEEEKNGQAVELCADVADAVLLNQGHFSRPEKARDIQQKIKDYIDLLRGKIFRTASLREYFMNLASQSAIRSLCLQRNVGAIIVDQDQNVVSTGYNENPEPIQPCVIQFEWCYKNHWIEEFFRSRKEHYCPKCKKLVSPIAPRFRCPNCDFDLRREHFPDRGMSRCTAIHAEDRAISSAGGRRLIDCTIYTTTFPCFKCAQKIILAGIREIVYIEPYPDPDSAEFLHEGGVVFHPFEGMKARAFQRVFGQTRLQLVNMITGKET